MSIKERLGLDFLKPFTDKSSAAAPAKESADEYLENAVLAFTGPVLDVLKDRQPASLYSVVDKAKIPLDVANKVVDVLAKRQLVRVIEHDPMKLDHKIEITEAGARLVSG